MHRIGVQRTMWYRLVTLAGMIGMSTGSVLYGQTGPVYTVLTVRPQPQTHQPGERITLELRDVTVEEALHQIATRFGLALGWSKAKVPLAGKVTLALHDVTVHEALAKILNGTGAQGVLSSDGQTIVIVREKPGMTPMAGAVGVVCGRVTDSASGAGLGGAAVKVEGTSLSAVTSDSGRFTLRDVPAGEQVVTVKLFGYKPASQTITVVDSQRTTMRVILVPVPTVLSGVVTTATGVQRRIEVGNDITVLNADSIMRVAPVQTVTDLLETRVPGLTVVHSDGVPGDPARLRLRGVSSIQLNNDPIVIVDGIRVYASQSDTRNQNLAPSSGSGSGEYGLAAGNQTYNAPSPLDQIDPNSIATIEVLKGPSASAIYGSDAAAGVIVITTKHGRSGPAHWDLAVGAGVNWLPGSWPANYYKFGTSEFGGGSLCVWNDVSCHVDSVVAFQALNDPRYTVFSHGNDQTAALTVSGGDQTFLYSLTGSGSGDLGNLKLPANEQARYDSLYGQTYGKIPGYLVRPDRYTTWRGDGSITANVSPTFSATVQSSFFSGTQQHGSLESAINQLQGAYISPVSGTVFATGATLNPDVPLIQSEFERVTDDQVSTTNSVTLRWQPRPWLPITATGGVNTIQRRDVSYVPFGIYNGSIDGDDQEEEAFDTSGYYGLGHGSSQDNTVNVGTTMPLFRHRVNLAVGGNLHTEQTADVVIGDGTLAPGVTVPTTFFADCVDAATCTVGYNAMTSQSTYGWYVEPQLAWASRFFVAPGFRLDGGSGAATSAGSVGGLSGFPKMDFSYVAVDRQSGAPLWGFLSLLRPRVAFGLAGTQPGPADKLRLYNVGSYQLAGPSIENPNLAKDSTSYCNTTVTLEDGSVPAVCLDYLGNTQLRPERSSEIEGGVDATLWRNRVSITYTQYNKTRYDAIVPIPVAPSVFGDDRTIQKNIGEIRNTGVELTANFQVLQSRTLGWNVGAILSNDNNLVVRLNKGQPPIVLTETSYGTGSVQERVQAGYPLFGVFTRPIVGFADANHDGLIEPNEIVYGDSSIYIGQPDPKYQFNLMSDLALFDGRLTVHVGLAYQNGMTQINEGACLSGAFTSIMSQPGVSLATQASIAAANCGSLYGTFNDESGSSAIGLVQRVNTFRFNELSVNYTLPRTVAQWFHVPRMAMALQGSNLALHTNYRGFDPSVNAFATVSDGDETADNGQIPEPRIWWLRLTLGN